MPAATAGQPQDWNALALVYAMQQQSQQMHQQMMDMMRALQLNTNTRENRMLVTKTDGTSEDPKTWMKIYEMACDNNRWLTDKQKITHLKQAFIPGSAADRWFSSRIIDQENAPWLEWKASFIQAFALNRVDAAQIALDFCYSDGKILDYFYEKERRLKLAFSDLSVDTFVTLVLLGLPSDMQATLLGKDLNDKVTLVAEINKLVSVRPNSTDVTEGVEAPADENNTSLGELTEEPPAKETDYTSRRQWEGKPSRREQRKAKSKAKIAAVMMQGQQDEETPAHVAACLSGTTPLLHAVLVNGAKVQALLDTGAQKNVVSETLVHAAGWAMKKAERKTMSFNGTLATSHMIVEMTVSMASDSPFYQKCVSTQCEALVFRDLPVDLMIGNDTLLGLGIKLSLKQKNERPGSVNIPQTQQAETVMTKRTVQVQQCEHRSKNMGACFTKCMRTEDYTEAAADNQQWWLPMNDFKFIYNERGLYSYCDCYATDVWAYERPGDGLALLWSPRNQSLLKKYAERPDDLPQPFIEQFASSPSPTAQEMQQFDDEARRIREANQQAYMDWRTRKFPASKSLIRATLETYATRHNLPPPLGYETRSHYVYLRFRTREDGDLWLDAPLDGVFSDAGGEMQQHRLDPPQFVTSMRLPKFPDGSFAPTFVCTDTDVMMPGKEDVTWEPIDDRMPGKVDVVSEPIDDMIEELWLNMTGAQVIT